MYFYSPIVLANILPASSLPFCYVWNRPSLRIISSMQMCIHAQMEIARVDAILHLRVKSWTRKFMNMWKKMSVLRGAPNLTLGVCACKWTNICFLEPGFPRKITVETACQWLHHLGLKWFHELKVACFVWHERPNVIAGWKEWHMIDTESISHWCTITIVRSKISSYLSWWVNFQC